MEFTKATAEDAEKLARLGSDTFWDAYRTTSKLETAYIRAYMSKAFTVTQITAELRHPATSFFLATHKKKQVGYAKLVIGSTHDSVGFDRPLEISRIYLLKSFWSKGLGKQLLGKCIDFAVASNCDGVWLGVWQHNQRAIEFYTRNGFEIVGEMQFDLASSLHTDHVMSLRLSD